MTDAIVHLRALLGQINRRQNYWTAKGNSLCLNFQGCIKFSSPFGKIFKMGGKKGRERGERKEKRGKKKKRKKGHNKKRCGEHKKGYGKQKKYILGNFSSWVWEVFQSTEQFIPEISSERLFLWR